MSTRRALTPPLRTAVATAAVAVGLVAGAAGLAACGSDGSEPAASSNASTTTTVASDATTTVDDATDDGLPAKVEMADAQVLIGMSEADAQAKADDAGWTLRVSRIDGEDLPSTNDYNPQRVNVSVTDGEVDAILSIG